MLQSACLIAFLSTTLACQSLPGLGISLPNLPQLPSIPPPANLPSLPSLADLPHLLAAPPLSASAPLSPIPIPGLAPVSSPRKAVGNDDAKANTEARNKELLKKSHKYIAPASKENKCDDDPTGTVIAISTAPYQESTVQQNLNIQRRSLKLLETFTGKSVHRFGPYSEDSLNFDGFYAYKMSFVQIDDCEDARDFTTKAVSYSRHIERAIFKCHCENVAIAKIRK